MCIAQNYIFFCRGPFPFVLVLLRLKHAMLTRVYFYALKKGNCNVLLVSVPFFFEKTQNYFIPDILHNGLKTGIKRTFASRSFFYHARFQLVNIYKGCYRSPEAVSSPVKIINTLKNVN